MKGEKIMTIEIADRLIKLRKKNGYSQEELADKLGLSRQAVSKWERAEASPDTDNLICLAKLYGVSLDELLATEDDVETIVEEQVKEDKPEIKEGIVATDDEGNRVEIVDGGIHCYDKNNNEVKKSKSFKVLAALEGSLMILATIAYILLGALANMWYNGWVVFFLPEIICSIARCFTEKDAQKLNIAFISTFTFFFVCMVLPGLDAHLWHPMWVVFLAIPLYHSVVGAIYKAIGKKTDDDEDEEKEEN